MQNAGNNQVVKRKYFLLIVRHPTFAVHTGAVVPLVFLHGGHRQPEGPTCTCSSTSRILQRGTALSSAPLLDSACTWHKAGGEKLSPGRANLSSTCLRYRGPREAAGKKTMIFLPDVLSYSCSTPSSRERDEEGGTKPQ